VSAAPLLQVENLVKHYPITEGLFAREVGRVRAVDGISFEVGAGETLGLIGESGCGKSTAARSLLRLEEPTDGRVVVDGDDVTAMGDAALRRFRRRVGAIFQDPTASFDPRMTVRAAVAEPLVAQGVPAEQRERRVDALLERVGLSADDGSRYPHSLSGGQKQRAALARALSVGPDLLVADEPVSALDVSVQAEILDLLDGLGAEFDLSVLFITHDVAVVREVCDRVAVMYLGELVEVGPTEAVLTDPQHPYTRALVASVPDPVPGGSGRSTALTGDVPDPADPPPGCRFHTRCPEVIAPDGVVLPDEQYRAVRDLRVALRGESFDPGAHRDPDADEDFPARVRAAFDLPATLADDDAEAAVASALARLEGGDRTAALSALAPLASPCEATAPALAPTDAGHEAACLLHDGGGD
jgi:peptide/nickel transport system ATP-binding protein